MRYNYDNFGTWKTVLSREVVLSSAGPLSEIPLYMELATCEQIIIVCIIKN